MAELCCKTYSAIFVPNMYDFIPCSFGIIIPLPRNKNAGRNGWDGERKR